MKYPVIGGENSKCKIINAKFKIEDYELKK